MPNQSKEQRAKEGLVLPLTSQREQFQSKTIITVSSRSIDGAIPSLHSAYAAGVSPEISWNRIENARTYALIMEDPDAKVPKPFVHWVVWNIPPEVTTLPERMQGSPLDGTDGIWQGRTSRGSLGYFGPKPPVGDSPHHYHFQVFALDRELDVAAGAERDDLLKAMEGHVIAAGALVGTYRQAAKPA